MLDRAHGSWAQTSFPGDARNTTKGQKNSHKMKGVFEPLVCLIKRQLLDHASSHYSGASVPWPDPREGLNTYCISFMSGRDSRVMNWDAC